MQDRPKSFGGEGYQSPSPSYSSYGATSGGSTYVGGVNEMRGADIIAEYLVKEKAFSTVSTSRRTGSVTSPPASSSPPASWPTSTIA